MNDLKRITEDRAETVTPDILSRVWQGLNHHMNVRQASNGSHIERHQRFSYIFRVNLSFCVSFVLQAKFLQNNPNFKAAL
jgi:hypothetical protein